MTSSVHFDWCFNEFCFDPCHPYMECLLMLLNLGNIRETSPVFLLLNHFHSDNSGGWKAYAVDAEEGDRVEVEFYKVEELPTDCSGWSIAVCTLYLA